MVVDAGRVLMVEGFMDVVRSSESSIERKGKLIDKKNSPMSPNIIYLSAFTCRFGAKILLGETLNVWY